MMRPAVFVLNPVKNVQLIRQNRIQKGARKQLLSALIIILLLSGCTSADVARFLATPIAPAATTANATVPAATSGNRLLVLGNDGNLFTSKPDGTQRVALTTDASRIRSYTQATWSSTGDRIGWAKVEQNSTGLTSALITSRADGSARTELVTRFAPFYLYWSPDDSQLAYLSNWLDDGGQTIALHTVDPSDDSGEATLIETGQPLYFSWSPDSQQMITHVANERSALVTLANGEATVLSAASANFAAPQWSATGDHLLYVTNVDNIPELVLSDSKGEDPQLITNLSADNTISFSLNNRGDQLAYVETTEQLGFSTFGPLFVYDLAKETFSQLSDGPVLAFAWSPNGAALLFLAATVENDRIWLQVNVWDGEDVQAYGRFIPSPVFLSQYLPFADQYMQSIRFWAPDSSAVVYAGAGEDGQRGIWVQPLDADAQAQRVTDGLFATWSPK